jgi:prephenate dehydrogenase
MRMHAVDVGGDDLVMAAEADLVILAAPVRQNMAVLRELAEYVPGDAIVTDVGSTKRQVVDAPRSHRLRFGGGIPLAPPRRVSRPREAISPPALDSPQLHRRRRRRQADRGLARALGANGAG